MIIGEYRNKITVGKRTALPKKFREQLGENLILTRGYENSLVIVDKDKWEKIEGEILNGSFINSNIRDTSRFLIGSATELDLDTQGRFIIPTPLFDYAQLSEDIVFIGLVNWVEVWSTQLWEKRLEYLNNNSAQIADQLSNMNK